jgi:antitoxin component YwqK of YwqJK toxin-antitoxin module
MKINMLLVGLFFIISSYSNVVMSQNLSLNELQVLCGMTDYTQVDNYLRTKGWVYHDSKEGDDTHYNVISWSHTKNRYDDRARAWFKLYAYDDKPSKISYQYHDPNQNININNSIISLGYKKMEGDILDGLVVTKYSNINYILALNYSSEEDSDYSNATSTTYLVYVIKKSSVYDPDNGKKIKYYWDGVKKEEFTLLNGELHGTYISYSNNGNTELKANFVNGIKNGPFQVYYDDGTLKRTGNYINDKENGLFKEYFENGKISSEYYQKDDEFDGAYKSWYENGNLRGTATYKNGKKSGLYVSYYDDGNKMSEEKFENGNRFIKLFSMGKIIAEGNSKDDEKDGIWKYYNENGKIIKIENYNIGLLNGEYKNYNYLNDSTTLEMVMNYNEGKLHGIYELKLIEDTIIRKIEYGNYSNDLKHGKFQEVLGDSLIICNYKYGKFDGNYYLYRDQLRFLFGSIIRTNIDKLFLIEKGAYSNDLKTGYWEYYSFFGYTKIAEGNYISGDKDGLWKLYYGIYTNIGSSEPTSYSGKLSRHEFYKNGDLIKQELFSSLTDQEVPCKDPTSIEPCRMMVFEKFHEIAHFKNEKLHGIYVLSDSADNLLEKGTYENGQKHGTWEYRFIKNDIFHKRIIDYLFDKENGSIKLYENDTLTLEGELKDGKKHGFFKYYTEGIFSQSCNYYNGKKQGEWAFYNMNGIAFVKYICENDRILKFFKYDDNNASKIKLECTVKKQIVNKYEFEATDYSNDSTVTFNTIAESEVSDFIIWYLPYNGTLNGAFNIKVNGNERVKGQYLSGNKTGVWKYYFQEFKAESEVTYENDKVISEKYLNVEKGEPFNGKITILNPQNGEKEVVKINDGLRHGNTLFFLENEEKPIRKLNYKKGVLQE